jgi:hypothetical protein
MDFPANDTDEALTTECRIEANRLIAVSAA